MKCRLKRGCWAVIDIAALLLFVEQSSYVVSFSYRSSLIGWQVSPQAASDCCRIRLPNSHGQSCLSSRISTTLGVSDSITSIAGSTSSDEEEKKPLGFKPPQSTSSIVSTVSKFRVLKDYMWIRDTLEDLAAAEFACTVEAADDELEGSKRKRAVDYEKLFSKLDLRVRDMTTGRKLMERKRRSKEVENSDPFATLDEAGMGAVVYTRAQREELLGRILKTRNTLFEIIKAKDKDLPFGIQLPEISVPEISIEIPKEEAAASAPGPKLYVRNDGTVDWDGALQDRAALRKFGSAVWARINGQNPTTLDEGENDGRNVNGAESNSSKSEQVTARIDDTPQILEARQKLTVLSETLQDMQASHGTLLASGIRMGQAVANVNLASLDPSLRNQIRESAEALESIEVKVSFQTLVYELERIYAYLETELGNPLATGYVPLQDRLNVAEFGLLESQVESFHREIDANNDIDEDLLAVLMEQVTDFKRRLGIDYYVAGFTFDGDAILQWLSNLLQKTRSGLAFYVKGCQLFWNDILFCTRLILRAAQGYTLKPREVRNIRRTFKDIITFIPVVIILIIPLSPVGHVLVFGAIQRFFPDFFPSCFTEQRQNLLQLYETAEFSEVKIKETFKEKIARLLEALWFFVLSKSTGIFHQISDTEVEKKEE